MIWPIPTGFLRPPYLSVVPLAVATKRTHEVIQRYQAEGQKKYASYADHFILLHEAASPRRLRTSLVARPNPA